MKVKGICPSPALWLISAISINPMDNQLEEADVLQLPADHITAPKGSFPTGEAMPEETGCGVFHQRNPQARIGVPGGALGESLLAFLSAQQLELLVVPAGGRKGFTPLCSLI